MSKHELNCSCAVLFFRCHVSICPASVAEQLLPSTSRSVEPIRTLITFAVTGFPMWNTSALILISVIIVACLSTCAENTTTDEIYWALVLLQACSKYGEHEERTGFSSTGTVSKQSARLQLKRLSSPCLALLCISLQTVCDRQTDKRQLSHNLPSGDKYHFSVDQYHISILLLSVAQAEHLGCVSLCVCLCALTLMCKYVHVLYSINTFSCMDCTWWTI